MIRLPRRPVRYLVLLALAAAVPLTPATPPIPAPLPPRQSPATSPAPSPLSTPTATASPPPSPAPHPCSPSTSPDHRRVPVRRFPTVARRRPGGLPCPSRRVPPFLPNPRPTYLTSQ